MTTVITVQLTPQGLLIPRAALHDWSGRLFARSLVEHFIVSIGVFPVGSLVELATGEVAMVVDRHRLEPLRSHTQEPPSHS